MKAMIEATTLPLPNPQEWCTIKYACQRLNRSERTVRRMIAEKTLRVHRPRVATNAEQADMLWVAEVETVREGLFRTGRLTRKTGWRHGERTS